MKLVYERRGSGEPLVLLHGIGHRWQAWEPVLDLLAADHDVIALDLPGYGQSPPLPGPDNDLAALTDAIEDFCAELGIERPHVAGNSLGGLLALEMARRGSVRTATGLSPAGFWSRAEMAYAVAALRGSRALVRATPEPLLTRLARSTPTRKALFGLFFGRPGRHDWQAMAADALALRDAPAFEATLARSSTVLYWGRPRVPVTIAWGTRDMLLFPWQARRAQRWLPEARIVRLPGCGHVPMGDDPQLVARVVRETTASVTR